MSVPTPLRDPDENTGRGLQRVSAGVQQGRRAGLAPVRGTARGGANSSGGLVEVFEIPDFVPGTHDLGYCHWIFDENGTYP